MKIILPTEVLEGLKNGIKEALVTELELVDASDVEVEYLEIAGWVKVFYRAILQEGKKT